MEAPFDLYLASGSPRRRELLTQIGVRHQTLSVAVDESVHDDESPEVYVLRLAVAKARAGYAQQQDSQQRPVLGADTAIAIDDDILGKPADRDDALAMLRRLSGREHRVLSGVAVIDRDGEAMSRLSVSHVNFRTLSDSEIERYWASGEPADKAGSYAIQGLGALFVEHLNGSYSGVMGLPLFETAELLAQCGIAVLPESSNE